MIARISILVLLACRAVSAEFAWPAGVSNSGPYTVASNLTTVNVFTPNGADITENDMATHRYSHHTMIYHFGGVTAIAFTSGLQNEGDSGSQTAICFSHDEGATWSAPIQAVPSQCEWSTNRTQIGYRSTYPRNWQLFNGTNYLVVAVDKLHTNGTIAVGEALLAVPVYANGTVGTSVLISTNSYATRDGKPDPLPVYDSSLRDGLMQYSKVYGRWGGNIPYSATTEWTHYLLNESGLFTEPSTFSADGSTNNLYRFWRVNGDWNLGPPVDLYHVAQQYSTNGGATWGTLTSTTIPNDPSVTVGVRLTDGRFAIAGNPAPYSWGFRDPLYLALTGTNSTQIESVQSIRQGLNNTNKLWAGYGKTGAASYVDMIQVGEYLYLSYSVYKESIGFSKVWLYYREPQSKTAFVNRATIGSLVTP